MKEYQYTGKAMGTDFSISIVSSSETLSNNLADKAIQTITQYENKFSRFIPASELSQVNDKKELQVSPEFMEVFQEALRLFTLTNGAFNPLVQIERFGYDKNFKDLPSEVNLDASSETYNIDIHSIKLDKEKSTLVLQHDQKLDFGGFLKGYLAEKLCKEICASSQEVQGAIINIGGDLHTQGVDTQGEKFVFEIYNPLTQKDDIFVPVHNQSLATSGTYKRVWQTGGREMHHILDSTGIENPKNDIISVSIVTDLGGDSEAFTKVVLSLGKEKSLEFLAPQNIHYIIIQKDGTITKNIS